jgi:tetrahydromethanopterin S-methyltransferase subunit F
MNKKEKMPTEISLLWAPNISAIAIMVDDVRMSAEDVKREYPLYSKQLSDMFNV